MRGQKLLPNFIDEFIDCGHQCCDVPVSAVGEGLDEPHVESSPSWPSLASTAARESLSPLRSQGVAENRGPTGLTRPDECFDRPDDDSWATILRGQVVRSQVALPWARRSSGTS